jgi:hypothetical protein
VDDYRIFLKSDNDPYDALAFLAEQLGINEGLSLNAAKTKVYTRNEYIEHLKALTADIVDEAQGAALDALTSDLYLDEEPDPTELNKLKNLNLLDYLMEAMNHDVLDPGRIKVIFRAMKIAKPPEAIAYLSQNFAELVVFAKDVALLMQELEAENRGCFNSIANSVIDSILNPPASSIQLIRSWLLELFVRRVLPIDADRLKKLDQLNSVSDKRQLYLIRGIHKDTHYFRKMKTAFGNLSPMEQPCLIWGAACLPKDEFQAWLKTIRPKFSGPTQQIYLRWTQDNQSKILQRLGG